MCSSPVIKAEGLTKRYYHYGNPLRQLLGACGAKSLGEELTALAPLSFEVKRGESIGVIGRNGSGKSTLLSLIAGTSAPSSGQVQTSGRVVALLELGSGFDPNFTGRENVYFNGQILGLSKKEIDERFEAIAAFADIGASLERPVRTYSSGMQMRLAFSVAAHTDADVLIIDESLAVGDAAFVQKCMRFLRSFRERGTLMFVSHDMASVKALCDRAIWLEKGVLQQDGPASSVGDAYLAALYGAQTQVADDAPKAERKAAAPKPMQAEGFEFNPDSEQFGDGAAELTDITLYHEDGQPVTHLKGGEKVTLTLTARNASGQAIEKPILGFFVRDRLGQALFGANTVARAEDDRPALMPGASISASFTFAMPRLVTGSYAMTAAIASGSQAEHTPHDWRHEMMVFDVVASAFNHGIMDILMEDVAINYRETEDDAA